MTDDRLIELIEQQPADELSGEELAEIRARLAVSPALREAMLGRLRLDQTLHQSVSQFRLPVELLLAKAAAMHATTTVAKLFGWGSVGGLLMGLVTVGTLVSLPDRPPAIEKVTIDEPESPSDLAPGEGPAVASKGERPSAVGSRQTARFSGVAMGLNEAATELYFSDEHEAAAWRESLESLSGEVSQRWVGERTELVLQGAQSLKSESSWPTSGRMRLTLADHDRFKIHLSSSPDAIASVDLPDRPTWPTSPSSLTLEYFAKPEPLWVAWLAAQRANQILPETLAMAAHDGGAASRVKAATIDIGYRGGEIVVTHGDTELLAAPLAGPPDLIVFEGDAVLRGLAFAEGLVSAAERGVAWPIADAAPRPADRDWKCDLPQGADWSTLAEGRVELFAEDSQSEARAACSLGDVRKDLEIYIQLEDPLSGTGIYLSDEGGDIRYRLSFIPGDNASRVCFAASLGDVTLPVLPGGPVPLCPAHPWFRLAVTDGLLKAWFSCNGAHWSPVLGPSAVIEGRITAAGVYCLAGPGTRSIRVARFAAAGAEPLQPQPLEELFGSLDRHSRLSLRERFRGQGGTP